MIRALISIVLCTVGWFSTIASSAQIQHPERITEVDLRIKGVGLGSSYALVLRQFGRPVSSKREKMDDDFGVCGPAYTSLLLSYKGAVVELSGDLRGRDFKVISLEITSPQLLITPGIKIGMTEQEARSKLGEPWQERSESGLRILSYVTKGNDGGAGLHFRNGRLMKVDWSYTPC